MKKTITFNQLKRLVKEARFGGKLKSLDDPAFTDTQDEYNKRKLRNQMLKDMASIEKNEDLKEASLLLEKIHEILQKRKIEEPTSMWDLSWDDTNPGISSGYDAYGIFTSSDYVLWYHVQDEDDSGWGIEGLGKGVVDDATADGLVNILLDELDPPEQQEVANAIHRMADKLPEFLSKVEKCYNEFVTLPGVKVSEGRFANKIKALDKVGEGRFANKLKQLEMLGEDDEVAANVDVDYDDEDGQEPGIPQEVEPAIDNHLCEMIADLANSYFDMDVDDYETRAIADEQLNSIYTGMRSLALKWLKAVKDSK